MINYSDSQRALRTARALLASCRTPRLREGLVDALAGKAESLPGPLSQVSWLRCGTDPNAEQLESDIAAVQAVGSDLYALTVPRIASWPSRGPDKLAAVDTLMRRALSDAGQRGLGEAELNAALGMAVADVAGIRRYAVDFGIIERTVDGSRYWYRGLDGHPRERSNGE